MDARNELKGEWAALVARAIATSKQGADLIDLVEEERLPNGRVNGLPQVLHKGYSCLFPFAPSSAYFFGKLIEASKKAKYFNVVTNREDENIKATTFLEIFSATKEFDRSSKVLTATVNRPAPHWKPDEALGINEKTSAREGRYVGSTGGAIVTPHIDNPTNAILTTLISGKELWVSWPPTKGNLDKLAIAADATYVPLAKTVPLMRSMEGILVNILNPGDALFMPPGMIHAVVSLVSSSHHSAEVHGGILSANDIQNIKRSLEWQVNRLDFVLQNEPRLLAQRSVQVKSWLRRFKDEQLSSPGFSDEMWTKVLEFGRRARGKSSTKRKPTNDDTGSTFDGVKKPRNEP